MSSFSVEEKSGDDHSQENNLRKGPWTPEEDEILAAHVTKHGTGNWNLVQINSGLLRSGKSCRLRWTNHLRPDLRRGAFSKEEQNKVIQLHASMGNKWAKMAQQLPGRTDNEIKNFWNTRLKKRKRVGLELYPDGIKPKFAPNPETGLITYTHHDPGIGTSSCVPHSVFNNFSNTQNQPLCAQPVSVIREKRQLPMIPEEEEFSEVHEELQNLQMYMLPEELQLHELPEETQQCKLPEEAQQCEIPPEQLQLFQVAASQRQQLSQITEDIMQLSHVLENTDLHNFDELLEDFMCDEGACRGDPSSVSELPPLPSSFGDFPSDESMAVQENSQSETNEYYEPRSPRSNGYLESIFYPPKVSQESDDVFMQGELNLENNRQNSDQNEPQNDDVFGDFRWVENQDDDPYKDTLFGVIHHCFKR